MKSVKRKRNNDELNINLSNNFENKILKSMSMTDKEEVNVTHEVQGTNYKESKSYFLNQGAQPIKEEPNDFSEYIDIEKDNDNTSQVFERIPFQHGEDIASCVKKDSIWPIENEPQTPYCNGHVSNHYIEKTYVRKALRRIVDKQKLAVRYIHMALLKFESVTNNLQELLDDEIMSCKEAYPQDEDHDQNYFGEILHGTDDSKSQEGLIEDFVVKSGVDSSEIPITESSLLPSRPLSENGETKKGRIRKVKALELSQISSDIGQDCEEKVRGETSGVPIGHTKDHSEPWINPSDVDLYIKTVNLSKGRGVFARRKYLEGEFITTYLGEIRGGTPPPSYSHQYIFKFTHRGSDKWMDAREEDNSFGRLINDDHENPNCKTVIKEDGYGMPFVCFFALREIQEDEELSYDYGPKGSPEQFPWRDKNKLRTLPTAGTDHQKTSQLKPSEIKVEDDNLLSVLGESSHHYDDLQLRLLTDYKYSMQKSDKYSGSLNESTENNCETLNHSLFNDSKSTVLDEERLLSEILQIPVEMVKCMKSKSKRRKYIKRESIGSNSMESNLECILNVGDETEIPENENSIFVRQSYNTPERRVWDKLQYCIYCYKGFTNITKHLFNHHKSESDVMKILSLPKFSKDRKLMLEKLRNRGNYYHNCEVIRQGRGEIIPWRCPPHFISYKKYVSCKHCLAFFLRDEFLKHEKQCPHKDFVGC